MMTKEDYYGRIFTKYQLTEAERQAAQKLPSITGDKSCFRCGTPFAEEHRLPKGAYYCRECLIFGRLRTDESLYYFPQQPFPTQSCLQWQGTLTDWQQEVSTALCKNILEKRPTLVHAVTGAGKTEMIYETIAAVIDRGGAVCLASPRVDVCIELHQRLQQDFSCQISLLHGEAKGYVRAPLVIATTHQLLKFYQAFDLVLVDEVDAFPYVDNPILYHAVRQSIKTDGVSAFLTATSTKELDKKVERGQLNRLQLPRRFHGNPLVIPRKIWMPQKGKKHRDKKLPKVFINSLSVQRATGYPLLIFAPEIALGEELSQLLQLQFPKEAIGFVSSQTENRAVLVERFRKKEISILVSTTILERGVTFPCVDVFVFQAHHDLFTSSSLIQIAGRAGRSMARPTGDVVFFHEGSTRAIEKAIAEIKQMNKEAGYERVSPM